jgi:methenyltetrahydromethanopterin cyclohydrolase
VSEYVHHVSGFFVRREEAELARTRIINCGLHEIHVQIYSKDHTAIALDLKTNSNGGLEDMLVDKVMGSTADVGVGTLGELALVASNVTLFVASPLIASLVTLGWGARLGVDAAAAVGSIHKGKINSQFSDLVCDAILDGQAVLVVTSLAAVDTRSAAYIIEAAVGTDENETALTVPGELYE